MKVKLEPIAMKKTVIGRVAISPNRQVHGVIYT